MSRIHSYDEEKVSFYQIDRHAKSIPSDQFGNIDSVIRYLRKPVPRDSEHRELLLARAIIVWLGQRLEEVLSGIYRYTPDTIVDYVESGELAYVFEILCRKAGVDCVVIEGYSKDSRYRPGDEGCCAGLWNAFVADGRWHLVHPVWCIMCLEGQMNGDEIQIEVDGRAVVARDDEDADQRTVLHFNEFWFCTNPAIFALHCYPLDGAWQLQQHDHHQIRDVEDFCGLPYLHSLFFENKLRLISDYSCLLSSTDGKCKVVFLSEKNSAKYIDFSYTLSVLSTDDDDDDDTLERAIEDMPLLVFYARHQETISFEITFPLIGLYMFRLFIDDLESETLGFCCEFNIVCTEVDTTCKKLPIDAGSIGWGYGHQAEEAGLIQPLVTSPILNLKPIPGGSAGSNQKEKRKIRFDLDEDLIDDIEYDAELYVDPKDVEVSMIPGTTETKVDRTKGELEVHFSLETDRDYALVVKARRKEEEETKAVLNFLLQTKESEVAYPSEGNIHLKQKMRELQAIEKRADKIEKKRKLEETVLLMQEDLLAIKRTLREEGHDVPDDDIDEEIAMENARLGVVDNNMFGSTSEFDVEHLCEYDDFIDESNYYVNDIYPRKLAPISGKFENKDRQQQRPNSDTTAVCVIL